MIGLERRQRRAPRLLVDRARLSIDLDHAGRQVHGDDHRGEASNGESGATGDEPRLIRPLLWLAHRAGIATSRNRATVPLTESTKSGVCDDADPSDDAGTSEHSEE